MNPDRQLVRRFHLDGTVPVTMDTNPLSIALGTVLQTWDGTEKSLEVSFHPGPQFIQGAGVLQGGAVAAMLDFAMGFAVMALLPEDMTMATAQLAVNFQRAANAGPCSAIAYVEKKGRTLAFARAYLKGASGSLIATATAVCSLFPIAAHEH